MVKEKISKVKVIVNANYEMRSIPGMCCIPTYLHILTNHLQVHPFNSVESFYKDRQICVCDSLTNDLKD